MNSAARKALTSIIIHKVNALLVNKGYFYATVFKLICLGAGVEGIIQFLPKNKAASVRSSS